MESLFLLRKYAILKPVMVIIGKDWKICIFIQGVFANMSISICMVQSITKSDGCIMPNSQMKLAKFHKGNYNLYIHN
ncbi:hypothetical protein T472_0212360 [Youngiibacter fragilis 232.1]|uniref:Uncharacterized protein n=1 Tax=Youngiibacter fragilis 232.1 TaxID=994573 RepID=V7I4X7_9CLOT|nr:hypothetical protein T472_0212360 [Youngiibacter fragilis 232.1]